MADAFLTTAKNLLKKEDQLGDAEAAAEQALKLFRDGKDSKGMAEALRCLVGLKILAEDKDGALRIVREQVEAVERARDKLGQARLMTVQAEVMLHREDPIETLSLAAAARIILQQLGDKEEEVKTIATAVVNAHVCQQDSGEAINAANEMLALASQTGDKKTQATAFLAALNAYLVGESREALEFGRRALQLFRELGDGEQEATTLMVLASAHLILSSPAEAASTASEAMNMLKDMESKKMFALSFQTLIQALVNSQQPKEAVKRGEEEMAKCQRAKDKKLESLITPSIITAHIANGASDVAARKARTSLRIYQDLGDVRGEANMLKTLAELQFQAKQYGEAESSVKSALSMFRDIRDSKGEEACLLVLDHVCVAKGEPDEAPHRAEALSLLREMARALEERNGPEFQDLTKRFNEIGGVTQQEMDEAMTPVVQKDQEGARSFIRKCTGNDPMASQDSGGAQQRGTLIKTVEHKQFYAGFRYGGLGYGPKFRCVKAPVARPGKGEAFAVMRVSSESESWEQELLMHPGILDGNLQTGAASSHTG